MKPHNSQLKRPFSGRLIKLSFLLYKLLPSHAHLHWYCFILLFVELITPLQGWEKCAYKKATKIDWKGKHSKKNKSTNENADRTTLTKSEDNDDDRGGGGGGGGGGDDDDDDDDNDLQVLRFSQSSG